MWVVLFEKQDEYYIKAHLARILSFYEIRSKRNVKVNL